MKKIKSKFQIIHPKLKRGVVYIIPSIKREDSIYTVDALINFLGLTNDVWDELTEVKRLLSYNDNYFNKPVYFAINSLSKHPVASRDLNIIHNVFPSIPRGRIHVFKYYTLDKITHDLLNKKYNPFFNLDIEINIK